MRKQLLVLILLLGSLASFSQRIEINDRGLKINSVRITQNTTPAMLKLILGRPDHTVQKFQQTVWTYDDEGMMVYVDTRSNSFSIILCYKPTQFDFYPKYLYSNIIKVFGEIITPDSKKQELFDIPELVFDDMQAEGTYVATVSGLKFVMEAFSDDLRSIEISF